MSPRPPLLRRPGCPLRWVVVSLCLGCAAPPGAPAELDELVRYLFREFEAQEPEVLGEGLQNLDALVADLDLSADLDERSWKLAPINADDLAGITYPDRSLSDCTTLALAYGSPWSPSAHTAYLILSDLSVLGTATSYQRSFLETEDPACFAEQSCDVLRTENVITRESLLFSMSYRQRKDYRWVVLPEGEWGILARGWLEESAHGDADNNHMWQAYEVEVWLPTDRGTTRYYASYTEIDYAGISEEIGRSLGLQGAEDAMIAADEWLDAAR